LGTVGNATSVRPGNDIPLDAQGMGSSINTLGGTFSTISASGVYNGSSSVTNSWNTYMTGSNTADFNESYNVEAAFTSGNRGSFGAAGTVEQMWDFYRVAQFPNEAMSGVGIYEGTFTLNSSGDVSFIAAAAVPEPSTYAMMGIACVAAAFHFFRRKKKTA
jgi:hypothetical protein